MALSGTIGNRVELWGTKGLQIMIEIVGTDLPKTNSDIYSTSFCPVPRANSTHVIGITPLVIHGKYNSTNITSKPCNCKEMYYWNNNTQVYIHKRCTLIQVLPPLKVGPMRCWFLGKICMSGQQKDRWIEFGVSIGWRKYLYECTHFAYVNLWIAGGFYHILKYCLYRTCRKNVILSPFSVL